jgi:protein-L-isoaspartate(D-aspartate) O-methyltransferase
VIRLIVIVIICSIAATVSAGAPQEGHGDEWERKMTQRRHDMVETQIRRRGIRDARVLDALMAVERHQFVPDGAVDHAYRDSPLSIGHGQTISQPYIVALMTEILEPEPDDSVLEIGTGSGYQAAVLSLLVDHVYTIEIVEALGREAAERLQRLGYDNITVRLGDGYQGWPEHAPFDAIIVTAAPPEIPQALVDQLADGGRMIVPVGDTYQELILIERKGDKVTRRNVAAVRFVPMVHGDESRELPPNE